MAICGLMLMAFRDACNHEESNLKREEHYDDYNLQCGISFARSMLEGGHGFFPHDTDIDCRLFIRWARNQRKLLALEKRRN